MNSMLEYVRKNRETIDGWCKEGWKWSVPISHQEFTQAKSGDCRLYVTPTKPVPSGWLMSIKGANVLGLAAGGGQQGPLLTALGAKVTIMDFSQEQLSRERQVQRREGYEIRIVESDMTKRFPFEDREFDFILHPVSNVYVKEVLPVWKECNRVLKLGGYLIAGLDNGINYIVDENEEKIVSSLPFDPLANESHRHACMKENAGYQFSHGIEEQIGGQLKCGFTLLDVYADTNGEGRLDKMGIPTFCATLSQKTRNG